MTELILTNAERVKMHEDQRITAEYQEMRTAYPTATTSRICKSLAASGKFIPKSFAGIRAALIRTGAIKPVKRS